jgi:hypothetical protein
LFAVALESIFTLAGQLMILCVPKLRDSHPDLDVELAKKPQRTQSGYSFSSTLLKPLFKNVRLKLIIGPSLQAVNSFAFFMLLCVPKLRDLRPDLEAKTEVKRRAHRVSSRNAEHFCSIKNFASLLVAQKKAVPLLLSCLFPVSKRQCRRKL